MRVLKPRIPVLTTAIHIEEISDVAQPEYFGEENINEAFNNKIFEYIRPGEERIAVMLRTLDLKHWEIGWIMGLSKPEVEKILYRVRDRIERAGAKKELIVNEKTYNKLVI